MTLDQQDLERLRNWIKRRVEGIQYRRQMAPISMSIISQMKSLSRSASDQLMAPHRAKSEASLDRLESSLRELPEKIAAEEAKQQEMLAKARKRTAALEHWLGELS